MTSQKPKFAADRMLGRLATWLRVIGQDVIYGPHLCGHGLIRAARKENRLILTRDRKLAKKKPPEFLLIESDRHREQLRQVVENCRLAPLGVLFARCLRCNGLLEPVPKESVRGKVPEYVFDTQGNFSRCPECRRIYWPATHHRRMMEELREMGLF